MNQASRSTIRRESASAVRISRTEMDIDGSKVVMGREERGSPSVVESDEMMNEVLMQEKISAERNQLLKELEEKNYKINKIMADMGEMVAGEQRDMMD